MNKLDELMANYERSLFKQQNYIALIKSGRYPEKNLDGLSVDKAIEREEGILKILIKGKPKLSDAKELLLEEIEEIEGQLQQKKQDLKETA